MIKNKDDSYQKFLVFTIKNIFLVMVALTCLGQLRKRNWFAFGSPRSSKNKPSLKTLFLLYDKKYTRSTNEVKVDQKF